MTSNPVFCAIDTTDLAGALAMAARLRGLVGGLKVGLEFHTALGTAGVRAIIDHGLPVFLDLKFHDIPNTVAGAVRAAVRMQPTLTTLHTAGGKAMMQAAVAAADEESAKLGVVRPRLVGVTVLTSLSAEDLPTVGIQDAVLDQVKRLALLARESGLDGIVCSPQEVAAVRAVCGPDFQLVIPGIRPVWAGAQDQKRVMTPAEALAAGADLLVIGRPITGAADPAVAARRIFDEIQGDRA